MKGEIGIVVAVRIQKDTSSLFSPTYQVVTVKWASTGTASSVDMSMDVLRKISVDKLKKT